MKCKAVLTINFLGRSQQCPHELYESSTRKSLGLFTGSDRLIDLLAPGYTPGDSGLGLEPRPGLRLEPMTCAPRAVSAFWCLGRVGGGSSSVIDISHTASFSVTPVSNALAQDGLRVLCQHIAGWAALSQSGDFTALRGGRRSRWLACRPHPVCNS